MNLEKPAQFLLNLNLRCFNTSFVHKKYSGHVYIFIHHMSKYIFEFPPKNSKNVMFIHDVMVFEIKRMPEKSISYSMRKSSNELPTAVHQCADKHNLTKLMIINSKYLKNKTKKNIKPNSFNDFACWKVNEKQKHK